MKISTKGRYGLRIMLELAKNYPNSYLSSKEISINQGIPVKYLESIISLLSKAKFIKTQRGSMGGHMLLKEPKEYNVGEILRTLEGSLSLVECADCPEVCDKSHECSTIKIWKEINNAINNVVDNITLDDVLKDKITLSSEKKNGLYFL